MGASRCVAMMLLQDNVVNMQHDIHLQTIFTGIIAIVMLIMVVVFCIGGLIAIPLIRKVVNMSEMMEGKIVPLVDKSCELVTQLSPKIHSLTENVEQISFTVRGKVDELSETVNQLNHTVQEVNMRTRAHVSRVDGLVTEALTTAQNVSRTVQDGIRKPVHQIAGILAGVRVGLGTLIDRSPFVQSRPKETRPYDPSRPYDV